VDGKILTANDLKKTRSRQAVLETLEKASLPLTAEAIHASVLKVTHTSISTTYRTLLLYGIKGSY
jgi:Fe2+ or Zn2+ uptake regulation protein